VVVICCRLRVGGSDGACSFSIFCAVDSHFAAGGTFGGGIHGRGVLVDGRSRGGTFGSGQVYLLVMVQMMVGMVVKV